MPAPHDSLGLRLFAQRLADARVNDRRPAADIDPPTVFEPGEPGPGQQAPATAVADAQTRPFAVFRAFSFVSLVAITIAAVLLAMCYRYVSIHSIVAQSETSNELIAQAALGPIHEEIATFLAEAPLAPADAFPASIARSLHDLVVDTRVRKVKVYTSRGEVIFSTKSAEIGRHQADNPGVIGALAGRPTSKLIYRDAFNRFDGGTDEDNLIQTYLPLQRHHVGSIVGVFEIYTDVNAMVSDSEQAQMIIVGTAILVMVLLYMSLLAIVRRIEKVIDLQQEELRDRSELLAALSARMLNAQESEKRRIAAELHERVAQTLSAVKLNVETALAATRRGGNDAAAMLEAMVPALQAATQDVRAVALGLRPSSLDDLGLLATLRWLCREFAAKHPDIELQSRLDLAEEDIPPPLRSIIYRVAEDACAALAAEAAVRRIMLSLGSDGERIALTVRDDAVQGDAGDEGHPYARLRDRTLLSGGKFTARRNSWGGLVIKAIWLR